MLAPCYKAQLLGLAVILTLLQEQVHSHKHYTC